MKTRDLIERIQGYCELDVSRRVEISNYLSNEEAEEIIKRLEEYEELRETHGAVCKSLTKIIKEVMCGLNN